MSIVHIDAMAGLQCDYTDVPVEVLRGDDVLTIKAGPVTITMSRPADGVAGVEISEPKTLWLDLGCAMAPEPPPAPLTLVPEPRPSGQVHPFPGSVLGRRRARLHAVGSRTPDGAA